MITAGPVRMRRELRLLNYSRADSADIIHAARRTAWSRDSVLLIAEMDCGPARVRAKHGKRRHQRPERCGIYKCTSQRA